MQVPKYVADSWNEAAQKGPAGTPLARIHLASNTVSFPCRSISEGMLETCVPFKLGYSGE